MFQSGARYAVSDTTYAAECYRERETIKIIPEVVELIGVIVSLKNEQENYPDKFVVCCNKAKYHVKKLTQKIF